MFIRTPNPLRLAAVVLTAAAVPAAATETDERIIASARGSYNFKTYLKDDKITIASKNGAVTLTGMVQDEFHRALAEATVAGLPGVKGVNNQLSIRDQPGAVNPDAALRAKVQAAVVLHRNLSLARIDVEAKDGAVTLKGVADSEAQKKVATEYVQGLDGVARVDNQLTVGGERHRRRQELRRKIDDASITAQIKMALLFNKATSAVNTKVRTENGVVTLTGTAKSKAEKERVSQIVRSIEGIRQVRNRMTVEAA
ncbi:MAG: BON domain-containing protein [Holophaga sp.]|jgi:osmotically-inducible protein OsmY